MSVPCTAPERLLMSYRRRGCLVYSVLCGPGSDRLSQALRLSTIGAEGFNGRVRNGIGFEPPAKATKPAKNRMTLDFRMPQPARGSTPQAGRPATGWPSEHE